VGDIVIALNPYRWLPLYDSETRARYAEAGARRRGGGGSLNNFSEEDALPPHAYAVSVSAYERMSALAGGAAQSILVERRVLQLESAAASAGGGRRAQDVRRAANCALWSQGERKAGVERGASQSCFHSGRWCAQCFASRHSFCAHGASPHSPLPLSLSLSLQRILCAAGR